MNLPQFGWDQKAPLRSKTIKVKHKIDFDEGKVNSVVITATKCVLLVKLVEFVGKYILKRMKYDSKKKQKEAIRGEQEEQATSEIGTSNSGQLGLGANDNMGDTKEGPTQIKKSEKEPESSEIGAAGISGLAGNESNGNGDSDEITEESEAETKSQESTARKPGVAREEPTKKVEEEKS